MSVCGPFLVNFCIKCEISVHLYSFACGYPGVLVSLLKILFFPTVTQFGKLLIESSILNNYISLFFSFFFFGW